MPITRRDIDREHAAEAIRKFREKMGMERHEFAKTVGGRTQYVYVQDWEEGVNLPSVPYMNRLLEMGVKFRTVDGKMVKEPGEVVNVRDARKPSRPNPFDGDRPMPSRLEHVDPATLDWVEVAALAAAGAASAAVYEQVLRSLRGFSPPK